MPFSDAQLASLRKPLDPNMVAQRQQSGRSLSYLEGFEAINQANEILGYDGWSHTISRLDYNADIKTYMAIVLVKVHDGNGVTICQHEDVGCGIVAGERPEGHETAIKGAVTDAMKRALRCLGDQFGNALYDKTSDLHKKAGQQQNGQRVGSPAPSAPQPQQRAPLPTHDAPQLKSVVTGLLAKDAEAKAKLPKAVDDMTQEELTRTEAWLRQRAKRDGGQQ